MDRSLPGIFPFHPCRLVLLFFEAVLAFTGACGISCGWFNPEWQTRPMPSSRADSADFCASSWWYQESPRAEAHTSRLPEGDVFPYHMTIETRHTEPLSASCPDNDQSSCVRHTWQVLPIEELVGGTSRELAVPDP